MDGYNTISSNSEHDDNWLCFNNHCPFVSQCENGACMLKQRADGQQHWMVFDTAKEVKYVDTSDVPEWKSGTFMGSLFLYCTGLILDGEYINVQIQEESGP